VRFLFYWWKILFRFADASAAVKAFFPVSDVHAFDTDLTTGRWRVDEFAITQINADMGKTFA